MRSYKLTPPKAMITGLFNACSNSPWPEDGYARAHKLLAALRDKEYQFNIRQYNVSTRINARTHLLRRAIFGINAVGQTIFISMVPTWTGKPGNGKTFSSQGILNRQEKSGIFTQNTEK